MDSPRVHSSGGRTRYGPLRSDVNRYLKWAFVEAANVICRHRRRDPQRHVSRLYERVAHRKGHQKAISAVARHLAEATYWILTRREPYREPTHAAETTFRRREREHELHVSSSKLVKNWRRGRNMADPGDSPFDQDRSE